MHLLRTTAAVLSLLALYACGGGDGDAGRDANSSNNADSNGAVRGTSASAVGQSGAPASATMTPSASHASYTRMRFAQIMDPYGFAEPVEAARMLIPADWRLEGGVQWKANFGCPALTVSARWRAISPDGNSSVEFFPTDYREWHEDPLNRQTAQQLASMGQGCAHLPPVTAEEYVRNVFLRAVRPDARIDSITRNPEAERATVAMLRQSNAMLLQSNLISDIRARTATAHYTRQGNTGTIRGIASITLEMLARVSPSASMAMQGGMGNSTMWSISAEPLIIAEGPGNAIDSLAPMLHAMVSSVRPNPQWVGAVSQLMASIARGQQIEVAKRAAIWRDAQQYIANLQRETYEQRQASQERIADQFSMALRGVERYVDPSGQHVELSLGYTNAWSNGKGEYLLSNDPNFDPAVAFRENWTKMQRVGR